jgi:glycosyltransferase involved in cell wall biosynthesis
MAGYLLAGFFPGLRVIRNWGPDVLHVHFAVPTGVLGWALSLLSGIPYVLTVHLGDIPGAVPEKTAGWFRFIRPFTPPIWRRAAVVIAVSDFTRGLARDQYGVPVLVIPNGVDLETAALSERDLEVKSPPKVVFVGRFQPQKNLLFLIDALSRLRDLRWDCVLVGDGPQRTAIETSIREKGLEERIRLTGWLSQDEVWSHFRGSDLLAMPSLSEGLPVVGVHALAHGLAIVANRAGGLVDLVEDGVNGKLCEVGDESCFLESLRSCLEDSDRLRSMKGASLAMAKRYDIHRVGAAYEGVFNEVLA